jgi:hypothetical protein
LSYVKYVGLSYKKLPIRPTVIKTQKEGEEKNGLIGKQGI